MAFVAAKPWWIHGGRFQVPCQGSVEKQGASCIDHVCTIHYTSYNRHMPVQERTWSAIVRSRLAQHLSRFADMQSIPPFTPRYAVQFNAARVDSLPVEAHDRGWAVYPSDLYLPVNFSFGAERCWTCGSQGVFCEVVGLQGLEYGSITLDSSRFGCSTELSLFGKVSIPSFSVRSWWLKGTTNITNSTKLPRRSQHQCVSPPGPGVFANPALLALHPMLLDDRVFDGFCMNLVRFCPSAVLCGYLCWGIFPTAAFDMSAFLTVFPLTPSTDGQTTSLRITAPVGFVWIPFAEQGWQGYLPNITCKYCELIVTPQAWVSWECLG